MINVNQITAQLARMPDQALQQYAAMHKEDPYIMALAVSESNRRKEMRQAAQAPQGGPQPKVVDQELASMAPQRPMPPQAAMLPEEQGIARLPAGEMNYADGGIVAFADGGTPSSNMYDAWERMRREALAEESPQGLTPYGRAYSALPVQTVTRGPRESLEQERARNMAQVLNQGFVRTDPRAAEFNIPSIAEQVAGVPVTVADTAAQPAAPTTPTAPTGGTAPRAAGLAAAAGAPSAPAGMDINKMVTEALSAAGKSPNPFAADYEKLGKARVEAGEENVKGLEALQQKFADIYKGRRERLDTREAELTKTKDQHTGLALLQAGAAMMSTPGGIGRALGKGVQVGTEQYAAGMEKLQAAKDKISDARDRLEEIEAQRGEMSARELLKARNEVKSIGLNAQEDLIKANMQMYGVNRETAMKMVEMQVRVGTTQMEIAGRERAARISAGAPSAQMQLASALGGGSSPAQLAAGLQKMAEVTAGKTDMRTLYASYLSNREKNPAMSLEPTLSYSQFLSQFAIPTAPGNNPAAAPGTVRARPQ